MKPITLSISNWKLLLAQLHKDYPPSVLAIREKTKRVLGFTSREHTERVVNEYYEVELKEYEESKNSAWHFLGEPRKYYTQQVMKLDFYDEAKRTFFLIKYSEFLK